MKIILSLILFLSFVISENAYSGIFSKICKLDTFKGEKYIGSEDVICKKYGYGIGCKKTSEYKEYLEAYTNCKANGGKDTKKIAMKNCAEKATKYSKEIRSEFYKDCMNNEGY